MKIALFGASPRPDSLALKIQNRIISWNQTFFPINPKYEEIDGIKTYPDLISLPEMPDLVVFMTNPQISLALLDQVTAKKSKKSGFSQVLLMILYSQKLRLLVSKLTQHIAYSLHHKTL